MSRKLMFIFIGLLLFLTACSGGNEKLEKPVTLLNQDNNEITFPSEKPVLFFFITTYT